jgi:hypothetical protein
MEVARAMAAASDGLFKCLERVKGVIVHSQDKQKSEK